MQFGVYPLVPEKESERKCFPEPNRLLKCSSNWKEKLEPYGWSLPRVRNIANVMSASAKPLLRLEGIKKVFLTDEVGDSAVQTDCVSA